MALKKKHKCPEGLPGWLLTYGDLMSLLLTFFVLIVTFSSVQEAKFKSAIESFKGQLGVAKDVKVLKKIFQEQPSSIKPSVIRRIKLDTGGMSDENLEDVSYPDSEDFGRQEEILREISSDFKQKVKDNDDIIVKEIVRGLAIAIRSPILFDPGSATIKEGSKHILEMIADVIGPVDNALQIEGYTDNIPVSNSEFKSNWELSAARAQSVLYYFVGDQKIDSRRLSIAGYGEYHPFATNETPVGRAKNRVVRIVVLKKGYE